MTTLPPPTPPPPRPAPLPDPNSLDPSWPLPSAEADPLVPPLPVVPPSGGTPIWLTVTIGLLCLGLGLAVSFLRRPAPVVEPSVSARASATVSAEPPKPEPTLLQRAETGEAQAIDQLLLIAPAQRTLEQAVALGRGRFVQKSMALRHLRGELLKTTDEEGLRKLNTFAEDGETAREAVGILAELQGSRGADILYDIATSKMTPHEVALLAQQLLDSQAVRPKASPALALVLDLRDATTCEQRLGLLEKAIETGDRRLLKPVIALTRKAGCGETKRDDCNPCLRVDNAKILRDVLGKIQRRKPPSL